MDEKIFFLSVVFPLCFFCKPTIAQIVPDATLPNNYNISNLNNTTIVTEGTQVGSNLSHSFEKFSVPMNATIYFNNPDVQNISS